MGKTTYYPHGVRRDKTLSKNQHYHIRGDCMPTSNPDKLREKWARNKRAQRDHRRERQARRNEEATFMGQ